MPTPANLLTGSTAAVLAVLARQHYRDWGSRPAERTAVLPGDDLVPEPATVSTLAVSVHAAPEGVWRWLVQIGQGRGGWYSYDRLENLFGLDIHSTDEVRPEWQTLGVGDRVTMVRRGRGPLGQGYSMPVALVEPPRALVLRQQPPEHPWDSVWSFHLVPEGAGRTRLLSRSRTWVPPGRRGLAQQVGDELLRPVTVLMTRRMLLGIRARAEGTARPAAAVG